MVISKVHVTILKENGKNDSSHVIILDKPSTVDELIHLAFDKANLILDDYEINSIGVLNKETGSYDNVVEKSIEVKNLQKFEIHVKQKGQQLTKIVAEINGNNEPQEILMIDASNISNVKDLSKMVLEKLNFEESDTVITKVEIYEEDFNAYDTIENSIETKIDPFKGYRYQIKHRQKNEQHQQQQLCPKFNLPLDNLSTSKKDDVITRQALGHIAFLGELYDAHKDTFCGHSLFGGNNVDKHIKITDTERTITEYVFDDSYNEKFKKLDIEAELKASILCGMIGGGGLGKYISTSTKNTKETSASLICRMMTKHESINISNRSIINDLSIDAIKNSKSATHIVSAIQWGAAATAELTYKSETNESQDAIEGKLKFALAELEKCIGGGGHIDKRGNDKKYDENFHFKFYADALPNGEDIPQTVEKANEFMAKLPNLIKTANKGKGVPIMYTLVPISTFQSYIKDLEFSEMVFHKIDSNIAKKFKRKRSFTFWNIAIHSVRKNVELDQ